VATKMLRQDFVDFDFLDRAKNSISAERRRYFGEGAKTSYKVNGQMS